VMKPLDHSFRGLAISSDVNPSLCREDPYWGGASAVDEAVRNMTAVNATAHTIVDCLNFPNPEKPENLGDFKRACAGLYFAADRFQVPFVSGNVSLYNESAMGPIAPTPTLLTCGIAKDVRKCVSSDFKSSGSAIFLVGDTKNELRGSEYLRMLGLKGGSVPKVDPERTLKDSKSILKAMDAGLVQSCHDLSEGGLFASLAEMCIGGDLGADVSLHRMENMRTDEKLFSESNGRWLLEVKPKDAARVERLVGGIRIGTVKKKGQITIKDGKVSVLLDLKRVRDVWDSAIGREVQK